MLEAEGGGAGGAGGAGADSPTLRVALIQNDFQWLSDVATLLEEGLSFNGIPATDNGDNFELVTMESAELHGDDVEWINAYNRLEEFKPHIIISAAGSEFYPVMAELERGVGLDRTRPGAALLHPLALPVPRAHPSGRVLPRARSARGRHQYRLSSRQEPL